MVERLKVAIHEENFHSRGDCIKKRQFEDYISEQQSVEKALEYCRGSFPGTSAFPAPFDLI